MQNEEIEEALLNKSSDSPGSSPQVETPRKCWSCFGRPEMKARTITLGGIVQPPCKISNKVQNRKYTFLTFLPICLIEQFRFFLNQFFLVTALSQLVPALKIGILFTYFAPLGLVLLLSLTKEFVYEVQRFMRDQQTNNASYGCRNRQSGKVRAGEIQVGDVIQVGAGERVPADLVVLATSNGQGTVFIKTDQLDGETDWKLRKAARMTMSLPADQLIRGNLTVYANKPIGQIYKFQGIVSNQASRQVLSLENTLWANTVVASGSVVGTVVYTGKQTRMALNSKQPSTKIGITDIQINNLSKLIFAFLLVLAMIPTCLNGVWQKSTLIQIWRFIILLSSVIPVSMRVNLDLAKIKHSSWSINRDESMPGTLARNSNIPEELGRICYVFSDKTGTLTKNEMTFKRLSTIECNYSDTDINQITSQLQPAGIPALGLRNQQNQLLNALIRALSLCHNVTPVPEPPYLQASSPDELALVLAGKDFGFNLVSKDDDSCSISFNGHQQQRYQVLFNFPFSSERKRMGIVLRDSARKIHFFMKGADSVMVPLIKEQFRGFVDEECQNLSNEGLRTLVFGYKQLTDEWLDKWAAQYQASKQKFDQAKCERLVGQLQQSLLLLGITGVQDLLQNDIRKSLESLNSAGVKVWMLTGDKVQTAICICLSSGLKPTCATFFRIDPENDISSQLLEYKQVSATSVLVIDGASLAIALQNEPLFFSATQEAVAVACCRVSPLQKAQVVDGMKRHLTGKKMKKFRCLAIGDGGNDVAMIQASDVGVGIMGKQGRMAALSSDFSISEFRQLIRLMVWHGRNSYKRTSLLSQFIIHRGMLIAVIQLIFSISFYNVSVPIFNSILQLGYATLFTMMPVFALILDEDICEEVAVNETRLYSSLRKGREVSLFSFTSWLGRAVYQGTALLMLTLMLIGQSYALLQCCCFTSLMITEYLMCMIEMARPHWFTALSALLSFLIYSMLLTFFPALIEVQPLESKDFLSVALISLISLLPIYILRLTQRQLYPQESEKVMRDWRQKNKHIETTYPQYNQI